MPLAKIPRIGLGTYQNTGDQCYRTVLDALEIGYRHIDTAQYYENESAVGRAIADSSADREDIFLATKIWPDRLAYEAVFRATEDSLDALGVEYINLLYIHWPAGDYKPEETLSAFDELYDAETIRHIGVSNFTEELLETALMALDAPLVANQVEMHPLLQQQDLLPYLQSKDIILVAFSPLSRGEVFDVPVISDIAEKHNVSNAQVSLAWLLSKKNIVVIPKATSREHLADNYNALDLELDAEDIERIESLDRVVRNSDPEWGPDW